MGPAEAPALPTAHTRGLLHIFIHWYLYIPMYIYTVPGSHGWQGRLGDNLLFCLRLPRHPRGEWKLSAEHLSALQSYGSY